MNSSALNQTRISRLISAKLTINLRCVYIIQKEGAKRQGVSQDGTKHKAFISLPGNRFIMVFVACLYGIGLGVDTFHASRDPGKERSRDKYKRAVERRHQESRGTTVVRTRPF